MKEWFAWTFFAACCATALNMWDAGDDKIQIGAFLFAFTLAGVCYGLLMFGDWYHNRRKK